MAIRQILTDPDPVLRKTSRPVEHIDDRLRELVADMIETLNHANGVGLAAVQVGILKRVVVVQVDDEPMVLINPRIVDRGGSQTGEEGCLSVPGRSETVTRPNHVTVEAIDLDGNAFEAEGEELFARAICHELDHLDGVLYLDHLK